MRVNDADSISVFYGLKKAGELRRSGRDIIFSYDQAWLASGFPLSLALPLSSEVFAAEQTEAFFGNLLPEEGILAAICKARRLGWPPNINIMLPALMTVWPPCAIYAAQMALLMEIRLAAWRS